MGMLSGLATATENPSVGVSYRGSQGLLNRGLLVLL